MQSLHDDNICQAIPSELLYFFLSDSLQKKMYISLITSIEEEAMSSLMKLHEQFKSNNCIFADRHIPVILHQSVKVFCFTYDQNISNSRFIRKEIQ